MSAAPPGLSALLTPQLVPERAALPLHQRAPWARSDGPPVLTEQRAAALRRCVRVEALVTGAPPQRPQLPPAAAPPLLLGPATSLQEGEVAQADTSKGARTIALRPHTDGLAAASPSDRRCAFSASHPAPRPGQSACDQCLRRPGMRGAL